MPPIESLHGYGLIFAFHSRPNCGSNLHHFRDKARYWSKIAISSYPVAFDAPLGGLRRNIAIMFGRKN